MRKTYQWILASLLCMMGAMNVNAEEISLDEIPFWQHESAWGLEAPKTTPATPAWVIGEATGQPYGDSEVKNFADLTAYTKLVVTLVADTEGSPRFLFNRDVDEGQWADNEAESHLIDNTKNGWSAKYFSQDGNVYTVDLKQMVKDKGYAHLHAIKGANWADVTVESMVVVSQGKAKEVGWINLINNSNMEGDDVSSFFTRIYPDNAMPVPNSEITDGVGVNGGRGIMVAATEKNANAWDNQFWFRFNEPVNADTKYRVSFDYRADNDATVSTQAHAEPGDYIHYEMFGNLDFSTEWQTFTTEGVVTASQSTDAKKFLSVAFNLNELESANNYYFDNITFEVYKAGNMAYFSNDVILIDFGFDTNLPDLVEAANKMRIFFPNDCVSVKVNGVAQEIFSVEGFKDGRFYIFLNEAANDRDEVEVTFTNPSDPQFHLTYTSGTNIGADVADFKGTADLDPGIEENDGFPYIMVTPTLMDADPEDGSFNLPNSISEFKLIFDKNVDCAALQATINGQALGVNPATGFAEEVTLTHSGTFATGEYTIKVTKVYPEVRLADDIFGEFEITLNIGQVEIDPNDQPRDLIPAEYFANTSANGIPEGFIVTFGEEERTAEGSYGSGPRMFDFAAGGDFTKGLYFREGYVEYGSVAEHELVLEANKKYNITFNTAMWKDNGSKCRFQIFDANDEAVVTEMIDNTPNVNGNTSSPVSGSTITKVVYVPQASGNYRLRWTAATSETGDPGFIEVLLANVGCKYVPNQQGLEEILALSNALEDARTTLAENGDERYQGTAYSNLQATISQYESFTSTSPSAYFEAAATVEYAAQALKDHRALCDEYDTQIKAAIDVVRQNAEKKFAATELYAELKTIVDKYHGTSEWVNEAVVEDAEDWQLHYSYDVLTDDAQLATAVPELKEIAKTTSLLFTEGESKTSDTGVKVAIERLRLGAEDLKALGIPEDNWLVAAAGNALEDNDALAEEIKSAIKQTLYNELKNANSELFAETIDETTLETVTPTYDMTVFVKNPNIYKLSDTMDFTAEAVPGWTVPEGYNTPGLSCGWGSSQGNAKVAEDCMFQTWGSSYRVEQTITDLPAGVYTVQYGFGERMNDDEANFEDSYVFAITSSGEEVVGPCPGIGQSFPYANATLKDEWENEQTVTVTDGELTIGVNGGPSSHTFFNDVRVILVGPAPGFDYAAAAAAGISDAETTRVSNTVLFDLNGRRIKQARQGVVLKKQTMSDGSVRTKKVVVK